MINTKSISLSQDQFAIVDESDYEKVNEFKWYAHYNPTTNSFYAVRKIYLGKKKYKTQTMANFILGYENDDSHSVDHFNHNTLDNTQTNISIRTFKQQLINRRKYKSVKRQDLPPNITFDEKRNGYRVCIQGDENNGPINRFFQIHQEETDDEVKNIAIRFREKEIRKRHDYVIALKLQPIENAMNIIEEKKFFKNKNNTSECKNVTVYHNRCCALYYNENGKRAKKEFYYSTNENAYGKACEFAREKGLEHQDKRRRLK
jgi:hypothetical protein